MAPIADVGIPFLLAGLGIVLLLCLTGYLLTELAYRRRAVSVERLAERAAAEALRLGLQVVRGDRKCPETPS